ncbi:AAA family ATPase [Dictyoglomus thermophilum]|uniref:AAA family ATPase n=1 Tax=Dictyoglomus thermophilum TaxID=14 RepID=A0A7V3ZJW1_DICTH|nr:R3H domain-containing nucleic acid-binding protein [Dictyoglomus thermophilum]TYT22954.1 AAA family ATPase [Dictyoglomus thermophilum]
MNKLLQQIVDDLDKFLAIFPSDIKSRLEQDPDIKDLIEVVLDLGREIEARFYKKTVVFEGRFTTEEDLNYIIARVGEFSGDKRAGIERTLHRISAIENRHGRIIGLTCRVGRAVLGTVDIIRDVIETGKNILLLGRPGVGKTTLLRETARVLADELGKRVIIIDTSNEIGGDGDIPHPAIGRARRMQVPNPAKQHDVMIEAVENHMPEVIVIDEIGTELEAKAARTIAERGVQLIGTAHGITLQNLLLNPTLSDLVGGIQVVTLSDEEAKRRGTQKTVLERKAPPTFQVVIEIQERDRLAIHHDVAKTVDALLRGYIIKPEIRLRTPEGEVKKVEAPTIEPSEEEEEVSVFGKPEREKRTEPLKIFPYGISRNRLEKAIRNLGVPAFVVKNLSEANCLLILKAHQKRAKDLLKEAEKKGIKIAVLRSNTVTQIERFLSEEFGISVSTSKSDAEEEALREAQEGIEYVLTHDEPYELSPQPAYIRRLQHQLIQQYGLYSESVGVEPFRKVRIYPSH